MVRLFDPKDAPLPVCQEALVTVADLATKLDLTEYVGRIMHPLVSVTGGRRLGAAGRVDCLGVRMMVMRVRCGRLMSNQME